MPRERVLPELAGMTIQPAPTDTDPNGYKIVVTGQEDSLTPNGGNPAAAIFGAVARLNSDGTPDTPFGGLKDGNVLLYPDYSGVSAPVVQPNTNKILVIENDSTGSYVVRLNDNGTPEIIATAADLTFTGATGTFGPSIIAAQPNGQIILVGSSGSQIGVERLNIDGTPDTNTVINTNSDFEGANAVAIQPDGKILVAGYAGSALGAVNTSDSQSAVVRLNSDGSLDTTYGNDGTQIIDFGGSQDPSGYGEQFYALAIQPDGKAVLAGTTYNATTSNGPGYSISLAPAARRAMDVTTRTPSRANSASGHRHGTAGPGHFPGSSAGRS